MGNLIIQENVPLAPFTTLGIGGRAKYFTAIVNPGDMTEVISFSREKELPILIIGEGSNMVVGDGGFPGLAIKNEISGLDFKDKAKIAVGAGVRWDNFVEEAAKRGLEGVEKLSAIPGTVGAAPVQNIGAYGQEVAETVKTVRAVNLQTGEEKIFSKEECGFGYRKSAFNTTAKGKYFITEVVFNLKKGNAAELLKTREEIIATRTAKGHVASSYFAEVSRDKPVILRSAGSFFKNPIIGSDKFQTVKSKITDDSGQWFWELEGGKVKVSAARLIEEAGFKKGQKSVNGHVGISPFHSLVLVTYDGATARELLDLAKQIRAKIKNRLGILLDIEPELVEI